MEKLLEGLIEELTKRVLAKMSEDTSTMREFFRVKVKAADIEGLEEILQERFDDVRSSVIEDAESAAKDILDKVSISVDY